MSDGTYPRVLGCLPFVNGVTRDVFEDAGGRQFVLDGDGDPQYGVWILPRTPAWPDDSDDGPVPDAVVRLAGPDASR